MTPVHARNVFWAGFEAAMSAGLSFAAAFIVARLIGPSEFGIGAAAVAVHVLLWVAANALFADALVQRRALNDGVASSAFWASACFGTLAAAGQAGAGWVLAVLLNDTRLVGMCGVLAAPLPLVGAAGAIQGLLTRRRAYRALATRTVIGQGMATAVGIMAAFAGAGAWAVVLQQAVGSAAGALTLLVCARWRPDLACRARDVRELLHVGLPLMLSTLVLAARYRVFLLLLVGTAGSAALGETNMAFRLVDAVRELAFTAFWRLSLPVLSERQGDVPALRAACDRLVRLISVVMLPLCGAMALAVRPLTSLMLRDAWTPAGLAAEPLIGLMAMLSLMFPAGVAVVARGQTARALAGNVMCTTATLAGVVLLRPADAPHAVLAWLAAQAAVAPYTLWVNGRALGTGPLRPLGPGLPMIAVTAVGVLAALAAPQMAFPLTRLVVRLSIFLVVTGVGFIAIHAKVVRGRLLAATVRDR